MLAWGWLTLRGQHLACKCTLAGCEEHIFWSLHCCSQLLHKAFGYREESLMFLNLSSTKLCLEENFRVPNESNFDLLSDCRDLRRHSIWMQKIRTVFLRKILYIFQPEAFQAFYEHLLINTHNIPVRYVLAPLCASNGIRNDTRGNLGTEEKDGTTQGQGSEKSHYSLVSAVNMGHAMGSVYTGRGIGS